MYVCILYMYVFVCVCTGHCLIERGHHSSHVRVLTKEFIDFLCVCVGICMCSVSMCMGVYAYGAYMRMCVNVLNTCM